MKEYLQVPYLSTITNWFITVLIGSFAYISILAFFIPSPDGLILTEVLGAGMLIFIYTFLYSIPALAVLIFVNWRLNKQQLSYQSYRLRQIAWIILLVLGTFLLLLRFLFGDDLLFGTLFLLAAFFTYLGVALVVWLIAFTKYRKLFMQTD